ncbi:MAG: hypothetical protein HON55_02615 [Legionellales bacterium]|jgi:outer membrane lipopolysaccharide assembly protein LptE/RlpB|nr:hypothetical protein [Legionellales bacterium]
MMLKKVIAILIVIFVSACDGYSKLTYQYPERLQPIYIAEGSNYNDTLIIKEVKQRLTGYDINLTDNIKTAKTVINIQNTNKNTYKEVKNNLANNNSIFYKGSYNATITIKYPQNKKNIKQNINAVTPIIMLENQNVFASSDTQQIFNELKNDLINIIISKVLFAKDHDLSASTKKTI